MRKFVGWTLLVLAVLEFLAVVVLGYVGIFTHNNTCGNAALMSFFVGLFLGFAAAMTLDL